MELIITVPHIYRPASITCILFHLFKKYELNSVSA